MIHLFENLTDSNLITLQKGDRLRFPVSMAWAHSCGEYNFEVYKAAKQDCEQLNKEVLFGNLVPFKCATQGTFKIRIRNFDAKGVKQFAIYVNGKKFGRGFHGKAESLSEYVDKVVAHYKRNIKNWDIIRNGNIITFKSRHGCDLCGRPVTVGMGDYNILNSNNPCVSAVFVTTEMVTGHKCYSLTLLDIQEGNKIIINGITYTVQKGQTAESMKAWLLNGAEYLCVKNDQTLAITTQPGFRIVSNTNNPRLQLIYSHSDTEKDYYIASAIDVREGNVFNINGIQITADVTDTEETISDFYNSDAGFFTVETGAGTAVSVVPGTRQVNNVNSPTVNATLVISVPDQDMDRYAVNICEDVRGGNYYSLDNKVYIAKSGDTAVDVAYNLAGENISTFSYFKNEGDPLEVNVEKGFQRSESNMADVAPLCDSVQCCDKKSWILEFDARERGCYVALLRNQKGDIVRYSSRIIVKEDAGGEMVEFGNSGDAFGREFDADERFSIRLPIFLNDVVPQVYEEVFDTTSGKQIRGVTRITNQRGFVTDAVSTPWHETILMILKSEHVRIGGVDYSFIGDYSIPAKRPGKADLRSASGILTENGKLISNDSECLPGCG